MCVCVCVCCTLGGPHKCNSIYLYAILCACLSSIILPPRLIMMKMCTSNLALLHLQVLRLQRGGEPLWVVSSCVPDEKTIPECSCGSRRIFEFQVCMCVCVCVCVCVCLVYVHLCTV